MHESKAWVFNSILKKMYSKWTKIEASDFKSWKYLQRPQRISEVGSNIFSMNPKGKQQQQQQKRCINGFSCNGICTEKEMVYNG